MDSIYATKMDNSNHAHETVSIPIVEKIAVDGSVLDLSDVESYFPIPTEFIPDTQQLIFFFEMPTKSMENEGILNGDRLLIQCVSEFEDGERAVVVVNGVLVIGIYHNYNGVHHIVPQSNYMAPVITGHMIPVGKIIGSMRMMR